MVFESLVADIVNRFLGDFIDNLDGSQLKIGIWGGDVKLHNLEVKSSALDPFDLPVKIHNGFVDHMNLKIPWKNLYTQPVIAQIDDLYLVVVPNKGAVYNEEKAKQAESCQKQEELARLEENRRNRRKGKNSAVDSFTEKLVEQIIKNLQIKIKHIHVRYEDKFTNRKRPFCCGITLDGLEFQTTDKAWAPTILKETVKIFNKLVSLQNLSVYWNSDSKLMLSEETDKKKIRDTMRKLIASYSNKPGHEYVLQPINMTAKLILNQKPESDGSNWIIPKINLDVEMEQLVLSMNRHQYQDFLLFLDAQDQFQLASRYLKYRPKYAEYRGHYKEWWKFAYRCVLEDQIRRRRRNWSWEMMKAHRALVKDYRKAFLRKRTESSLDKESRAVIDRAEKILNVFNLNIARQEAEIEIDRRRLTRLEDKPKEGWGAWMSSWWGGKKEQTSASPLAADDSITVLDKFQKEMTETEKKKLYEAIDYQENMPPTDYPKHYIENRISVKLKTIAVIIEQSLELKFGNLSAYVEQRPSDNAILVKSAIKTLEMNASGQSMLSMLNAKRNWMDLEIETNPLKRNLDVIVLFRIQPVLLKYHAPAVNTAFDVFRPPESIRLEQLTNMAFSQYEGVKARSLAGLQYAVDKKSKIKIDIKIDSMTIVVSEGGTFDPNKANMIVELGTLSFTSTDKATPDAYQSIKDDKQREVVMAAYDKFKLTFSNVQLLYSVDYQAFDARLKKDSEHHILKPITLDINIHKAAVDDLNMAKMKVFGDLSDILIHTTDSKLIGLAGLLLSIPLPESDSFNEDAVVESIAATAKLKAIFQTSEVDLDKPDATQLDDEEETSAKNRKKIQEQQVLLDVSLKLNLIGVTVIKQDKTLIIARMNQFGFDFQMRTYDMVAHVHLGSITMEQPGFRDLKDKSKTLFFVDYPNKKQDHLIVMDVIKADKKSPFFDTEYKKTELLVKLEFRTVDLSLHTDALVEIKTFVEDVMKEIDSLKEKQIKAGTKLVACPSGTKLKPKASTTSIDSLFTKKLKKLERQKRHLDEVELNSIIGMHISAHLHALNVIVGDKDGAQTSVGIREISFDMILKPKTTTVLALLHAIVVKDETPGAVHTSLVSVQGKEAMFRMDLVLFNRTADERKKMRIHDVDMGVKINLAQIQFVFLYLCVNRMLSWIAPFQEQAEKAKEVAAERATEAAQAMIDAPPRMSLDVKLAAPKVIVPKMSTSREVICVDLGQLHLKNTFNKAGIALVDDMSIQLSDVNISTGRLDDDKLTENCQMLKPLSFIVSVARNLEFERVKDLPELTVKAYLPFIDLSMSQTDYVLMMHIVAGNLAEAPVAPPSKAPATAPRTADASQEPAITDKKTNVDASSAKRIVFRFAMDDIDLALYSGTGMAANKDHGDRNKKESFASMKMHELLVSGYMSEDGGMSVAVSLDAFSMSDEREEQTKLRQLMDKKPGQEQHKFVNLKLHKNSRGDKDIVIKSSAFYLFLSPEFLGKLSSFFVVPGLPNEAGISPAVVGKQEMAKHSAINAGTHVRPKTPAQSPASQQDETGSLALKGSINDIEIILIEDALNPKSSQALILSFNALLDGDTKDGQQHIVGEVRNLQIVSTYFAEELRHLASYNVLNKLDITLNIDIDMASQAQVVTAKMHTVHVKVSPAVIRLLSAVGNQFFENRIQPEDKKVPVLGEYPDFWRKQKYFKHEYWWFNDVAQEAAGEIQLDADEQRGARRLETATFSINRFVVTLESGTEEEPIPLILLESRLEATASSWSTSLACDAETQLQISYYNEAFSVWEPVIEPVLKEKNGQSVWGPWNMTMKLRSSSDSAEPGVVAPPKMQVSIDAVDVMNITVTKSFLLLLSSMSSAFEKAAKNQEPPKTRELPGNSPYLILNDTGVVIKIANSDSMKVTEGGAIDATHGEFLELNVSNWEQKVGLQQDEDNRKAELCLQMMDTTREVNVMRAETRSFRLPRYAASGRQWNVLVDTNIENNRRIVTLKSLVNFVNHTDMKLEVHSQRDTSLDFCGFVETNETPLNIALPLLYTPSGDFFIRPANGLYETSNESFSWHSLEETNRTIVRCEKSANPKERCYFNLVAVEEAVLGELGPLAVEKQWTIHIYPPMVFRNLLPFPVKLEEPKRQTLDGGEDVAVNVVPGMKLKLCFDYEGPYTAVFDIWPKHEELEVITFVSDKDATKELYLGIHWSTLHRRRDCQLYCPYWLVNNTGKELKYMDSVSGFKWSSSCSRRRAASQPGFCSRHPPNKNPVLLPFADKNFCSKKKAKVSIENSAFSQDIPLDIAGSAARVTCKDGDREYELTVDIQVCQSGLTKVVSFSPFYLLFNESAFAMEVCEPDSTEWISVDPESCTGLWPKQTSKRKMIMSRYLTTLAASIPFPFTENFGAFCSINSDHLGLYVTCSVGESSSVVHIEPFHLGMAPAQIMNATEFPVEFGQKGHAKTVLEPWETAFFKWEDVMTHDRKLEWKCGDHEAEDGLDRNTYSSFLPSKSKGYHYWVSFLMSRQRVFLLTDDLAVVRTAQQAYEVERMDLQTEINIQGIGISIVNNLVLQEILYMGISCSGVVWEQKVKNRFRMFAVQDVECLEDCYQKWLTGGEPEGRHELTLAGSSVDIDFNTMILYRRAKTSEVKIRRNYANGLWMLYRQSAHQRQVHLKVNHLQIDNQLPACVFPCVLAMVLPPHSVVADSAPKPFTELSLTMQNSEHLSIVQYKYLHVLVQEFAIRLDQGLINSLIAMFTTEATAAQYNKEMFQKDLELAQPHLSEKALSTAATQQKAFFDDLHISPLMIHLSFSQGGVVAGKLSHHAEDRAKKDKHGGSDIHSEFTNVLLKSIGVSLTELQDVVFKLGVFERRNVFYSRPQLQTEIQSHYAKQLIKQFYVLVLGLDIIGNPFGLVRDLSSSVNDLFSQSFHGPAHNPGEFAQDLARGVWIFCLHAVGATASAIARITGTLGKAVAALTFDEEYQRKRQEALNRRPQNLGEGLFRGAKGFGMGFYEGVTGIVTKPIEGVMKSGIFGFVTGLVKGIVGVLVKPVSGLVDLASSSLEAVKTVTGANEDTKALRPPRLIPRDQIVRPYNFTEAVGYKFFRDTDRGKYADTDNFVTYGLISDKCVFVVTDRRVFLVKRQPLLGTWISVVMLLFEEMSSISRTGNGILFELKPKKKRILGFGGPRGTFVQFNSKEIANKVFSRLDAAFDQTS